jgi:protein involved in polysaccharide export with SLBB domain
MFLSYNKLFRILVVGLCCVLAAVGDPPSLHAQGVPDISNIKVDELSDAQLQELVRRATSSGLSEAELLQMAQVRGVPSAEIEKLRKRLSDLDITGAGTGVLRNGEASKREPRRQMDFNEITQGLLTYQPDFELGENGSNIFGMNLFYSKDRKLNFAPNLNLATPQSYVLGPGDMLYVDIYGQSERYYEANITPEGTLILENIGPINVSGLTIEAATQVIKNRLSRFFTGLSGSNPSTFLQVSLGNIRTIQVHLVGELRLPGTFTLSAFSTVFNALYAAGGPSENGTMRNVKLIRNNKQIAVIDVYDFLVSGQAELNQRLQDQDVILVEPYAARVQVQGEVKRPMLFEVKEGESFQELLQYAGGFTEQAYKDRVAVIRNTGKEKAVSDIYQNQFSLFTTRGGDQYTVGRILDRYDNRVQIKGAVFREGNYALSEGLTLLGLIEKAEGLRGEAHLESASVLRTREDLSTELLQVNLRAMLAGTEKDISLQAEDIVRISSIYDLNEEFYVKITGEVQEPGIYPFSSNMTVEDLIVAAGGLRESASTSNVEIARRAQNTETGEISDLIPVQINPDLSFTVGSPTLQPFDNVLIRRKPNFALEKLVQVDGQVNSPGQYAVQNANERISDVIRRAGGLTQFAYPEGATLIRRTEFYQTESDKLRKEKDLFNLYERLATEAVDPSESQAMIMRRLNRPVSDSAAANNEAGDDILARTRAEVLTDISQNRSGLNDIKIRETEAIAIDLAAIMAHPGSGYDLILEEGDIISIPKQLQTVRLRGEVIYPTTVRHEPARPMSFYINRAGGFDNRAKKRRTYVVYANGEVARTKNFLFFKSYPSVEPGAEIIVPSKGPKIPFMPGEIIGITTGLATLALILTQIDFNNK